ncbi:jg1122 [Pararge aegeria aegeria]|uniref:Jg1122 protein n=1 Tax=Pararge aegeria aegeria TaxID=348720 RepID=A0A8S4R678_9NEOP|nr:jg1122 [Pararge aegeria aegeria]
MSSDYYFTKWKKTLASLQSLIELDLEYQETKAHDKQCCEAAQRLSGILGRYIVCYNDALECLKHNLQVQKTVYIANVVTAIVARIREINKHLRKLEAAYIHFINSGLIENKLTPFDVELADIPAKHERSQEINDSIIRALQTVAQIEERKDDKAGTEDAVSAHLELAKWRKNHLEIGDKKPKKLDITKIYEVEEKMSEETLRRKQKVVIIQAHERTRQITRLVIRQIRRKEIWAKELLGTLNPPAPIVIRQRSAALIQKVLRFYFELKRKKNKDCRRDELLQLRLCNKPSYKENSIHKVIINERFKLYKKYEDQRSAYNEEFKKSFFKRNHEDIAEHARDNIRDWFQKWYNEVMLFYDIPKENKGGSALIIKEEVLSPAEWKVQYEAYLVNKKANKRKTAQQLKLEKKLAKEEEIILKRENMEEKKLKADLLKKMMKNPKLHPGYKYPASKKTEPILQAINTYYQNWYDLDKKDMNAKEKFIKSIDEEQICMEVKLEINKVVDVDMREELNQLKRALKEDYKRDEKPMPEKIKERSKCRKKQRKTKLKRNENFDENLTYLAVSKVLKEYPRRDFEDFLGDSNFAGDNFRCILRPALHFGAETRAVWWESCRKVIHGFKRILLVGPRGSGKTRLVHILASVNDAILYELDPAQVSECHQTTEYLQQLVSYVSACAKTTQPSVIYIRDVQRLFYKKVPAKEIHINLDLMKRFFLRKLFKKIHHHDNVTIIGTCKDPWLTKSKPMLKIFPTVLLLPDTSYSAVYLMLQNWVLNNRIVPPDLDIHSLAHVLQGYSFGYLVKTLDDFLTADEIVK